jgi:hypothetical protein
MSDRVDKIKLAVEKAAGVPATHVESAVVLETFRGKTMWEGVVEVFRLDGHTRAKRAYGWNIGTGQDARYTAVLEIPPVDSPNTAVRAAIVHKQKKTAP